MNVRFEGLAIMWQPGREERRAGEQRKGKKSKIIWWKKMRSRGITRSSIMRGILYYVVPFGFTFQNNRAMEGSCRVWDDQIFLFE